MTDWSIDLPDDNTASLKIFTAKENYSDDPLSLKIYLVQSDIIRYLKESTKGINTIYYNYAGIVDTK